MYDTVNFRIGVEVVRDVDFLKETPRYFNVTGEHYFEAGAVVTGDLNGCKISVSQRGVHIKDGSLCKYYWGNNLQTLSREDTARAIASLSDTLHLPISEATITRLDVAQNFIMKHPPSVYMSHLGELKYSNRIMCAESSLYYRQSTGRLIFYDKIIEQRDKKQPIPELYADKNILRYEQRYQKRLPKTFNLKAVTGATLYDEGFYLNVVKRWTESYQAIQKINDRSLNFQGMKTKQGLYKMGILSMIERTGGQIQMLEQIAEAQKRGELSKKQAFDLRKAVNKACEIKESLMTPNEAILELDQKVREVAQSCR